MPEPVRAPPAVSVVMPAWNAAATIDAAAASILGQTEDRFELVVVDDGSTDDTAGRVARLAARDPRVVLLAGPHGGIVAALARGLDAARGRYVARMDADDVALPARLRRQREFLDAAPRLGLASCLVAHGGAGDAGRDTRGFERYVAWLNGLVSAEAIARNRFVESPVAHPSVMFRRELVARHGGYRDGAFPEDYELWLRWLEQGVAMAKVPEVLLRWNDPPGRLSRTHPNYAPEALYRLKAGYLARWLARHNPRHPEVVVWGAGRATRRRAELLEAHGCRITGWIDVVPARQARGVGGRPVHAPAAIPGPAFGFVVSYVGSRGAGAEIRAFLLGRGFVEGRDFVLAA